MSKSLSIVVPAYNEEASIEDILRRCLAARDEIAKSAGLSRVEVLAVDDGSRDRTQELARRFKEVKLVVHKANRGYGAALMSGFGAASGDYLAFLDADGTCDPKAFVGLLKALEEAGAELSIGNRLHAGSRMPRVRELGNRFYAAVVSALAGVSVGDTASGMRVFTRALLQRLSPLPAGLHFTPAMTARAACMGAKIVEVPIPYADRRGSSKLSVVADGLRFLEVILGIIFAYFPLRIFGPLGLFFAAVALGYSWTPVAYYREHGTLHEDMIYRLLTILTLAVCAQTVLTFGLVAQKASDIVTRKPPRPWEGAWLPRAAMALGAALGLAGIALNSRTLVEYASRGTISLHWGYVLTGGLAVISATVLFCFGVTLSIVAHLPRVLGREGR